MKPDCTAREEFSPKCRWCRPTGDRQHGSSRRLLGRAIDVIAGVQPIWRRQLSAVTLPERFAGCFGEIAEINPVVGTASWIACKTLPSNTPIVILGAEDTVRVADVRLPEHRLRCGGVDGHSNLPALLDEGLVLSLIVLIRHSHFQSLLQCFG